MLSTRREYGQTIQQFRLTHPAASNDLTGTIPTELGSCRSLVQLELANNNFENRIPSEIGSMAVLKRVDIRDNLLEGALPTELGSLSRLETMYLSGNALIGDMDPVVCDRPNSFPSWKFLEADCADVLVTCSCCTSCCNGADACCTPGTSACNNL